MQLLTITAAIFFTFSRAHEDHHREQIPVDYVKFPQPIYRATGEGWSFPSL